MQILSSTILIENLRIYAFHGVLPQERKVGAYFRVSLHIQTDFTQALEEDDLQGTINYATVYDKIKEEMQISSLLLEHVAGRIAQRLYQDFPTIEALTIRIEKENPPMGAECEHCGVEIQTRR